MVQPDGCCPAVGGAFAAAFVVTPSWCHATCGPRGVSAFEADQLVIVDVERASSSESQVALLRLGIQGH